MTSARASPSPGPWHHLQGAVTRIDAPTITEIGFALPWLDLPKRHLWCAGNTYLAVPSWLLITDTIPLPQPGSDRRPSCILATSGLPSVTQHALVLLPHASHFQACFWLASSPGLRCRSQPDLWLRSNARYSSPFLSCLPLTLTLPLAGLSLCGG